MEERKHNILIVGNGFDLAHGYKTSYHDYMNKLIELKEKRDKSLDEDKFLSFSLNNKFIQCFLSYYTNTKNTWIDFEKELKDIALTIDEYCTNDNYYDSGKYKYYSGDSKPIFVNQKIHHIFSVFDLLDINKYKDNYYGIVWKNIEEMIKKEFDDLKISLCKYLEMEFIDDRHDKLDQINHLDPYAIMSFNYTNTMYRYITDNIYFIHGNYGYVDEKNVNKIVLGFESTVHFKNNYMDFSFFYKDVQRAYYMTDDKYNNYRISSIPIFNETEYKDKNVIIHLYGLSLDKTDSDYINTIFKLDFVKKIIVYFYNKKSDSSFSSKQILLENLLNNFNEEDRILIIKKLENNEIIFKEALINY